MPTKTANGKLWTAQDVRNFLLAQGVSEYAIDLRDKAYCLPTQEAILAWRRVYIALRDGLKASGYHAEYWDCDDFQALADLAARIAWKETPGRPDAAILIGGWDFWQTTQAAHAVNCAIVEEDGKAKLCFYEGQLDLMEITLTQDQINGTIHANL